MRIAARAALIVLLSVATSAPSRYRGTRTHAEPQAPAR